MTLAMWLAWVLRPELRGGAAIDHAPALREHVAWWLVAGRRDYPDVWWYGPAQEAVAMELLPTPSGLRLPRLLLTLWRLWPELQGRFDLADRESCCDFLCWYRIAGPPTLPAAPALPAAALALTEAPSTAPGWTIDGQNLPRLAVTLATLHPPAGRTPPACRLDDAERRRLLAWFHAHRDAAIPPPKPPPAGPEPLPVTDPGADRRGNPRGVNLVGFARAEMGIGEDVRAMSAALDAAAVPHCVIDTLPDSGARLNDNRLAGRIVAAPRYATTVYCMTATDTALLYLRRGPAAFRAAWRIGSWAWELPRFPDVLVAAYALVDEVWAHSRYSAAAFEANAPVPVRLMPPAVTVPAPRLGPRPPRRPFTCLYQFDPNSYFARKNPEAAIAAFQRAFPAADRRTRLILRINGWLEDWPEPGARLAAAARRDPRIILREGTLPRATMLRMLAAADIFISPHRAEGFGRNIAEALLLGVPVLATGFSGSCDFLRPDEQIGWTPRAVAATDYPFADGQWWAEPDIAELAARLAAFAALVRAGHAPSTAARRRRAAAFNRTHGLRAAGRRYREVLLELRGGKRSGRPGLRPGPAGDSSPDPIS
jgi:glycosyltransferase involved in cell wall biosynthesis